MSFLRVDQVTGIHYLDDFLIFGASDSPQCGESLSKALARCDWLGVPISPTKTEGPATKLVFLGIEIDSVSMTIRLPPEKFSRLRAMIQEVIYQEGTFVPHWLFAARMPCD